MKARLIFNVRTSDAVETTPETMDADCAGFGRLSSYSILAKICVSAAVTIVILLAASRIWLIPVHVSWDQNEGWNAFQARDALGAGPLYPSPHALIGNNYPPLSFYIVGWAGHLFGDTIVAGRVVALISVLVVALCVFKSIGRFTGPNTPAPALGILLFLGFNVTLYRSYFCLDDPQWLAHALMMVGLVTIIPASPGASPTAGKVAVAAVLIFLGGLVKDNLIAFPIAITLWLTFYHRRALCYWISIAGAAVLSTSAIFYHIYGSDFFIDLLISERHYSLMRMLVKAAPIIAATGPLLVISTGLIPRRKSDNRTNLLLLAVATSVTFGIIEQSGQGVDRNAHFEALIALCIAGAVALNGGRLKSANSLPLSKMVLLILPFGVLIPVAVQQEVTTLVGLEKQQLGWQRIENQIESTRGKVACETSALCYWSKKDFELDFFLYGQRAAAQGNATALKTALDERRFAAIELDSPFQRRTHLGEITNPILQLIARRYITTFTDEDGRILVKPIASPLVAPQ